MSLLVILLSLLIQTTSFGNAGSYAKDKNVCVWSTCSSAQISDASPLFHACESSGFNMTSRCCYREEDGSIFGIDLSNCQVVNLKDLDLAGNYNTTPGYDRTAIEMIILDANPVKDCDEKSFDGMTNLNYVSMPPMCSCPLGDQEWDNVNRTQNETICSGSTCRRSGVTCPTNSHCQRQNGTNVVWCVCNSGYSGYKCMMTGTFPMLPFVAGIVSATAFISGLLWTISRRKVRKVD